MFTDFEYAGMKLSDYGFMVGSISGSSGAGTVSIGSELTFNSVKNHSSNIYTVTSTTYNDVYQAEPFQILRYDCNEGAIYPTEADIRALMKWLNRKEYAKFVPITDEWGYITETYWMGYFNAELTVDGGKIVGLELTFITNAPYGFGEPKTSENTLMSDEDSFGIYCDTDEIGYTYANAEITLNATGNLIIYNSLDSHYTSIDNCTAGEKIILDGERKIISSSLEHDKLANDFNYNFIRLFANYDDDINMFSSNLPIDVSITYTPVHKTGVV